jgi:hypothetical protein
MEKTKDEILVERLAKHPELRARMEQILTIVENSQGDANTADEAEERAVEEVRKLGQEILGAWAVEKEQKLEQGYLEERLGQVDNQGAIKKGFPIGSGEIESGNKSVLQAGLKIAGAWWKVENAEKMIGVRTNRANQEWEAYWKQQRVATA